MTKRDYVRQVLDAYLHTPTTAGRVNPPDRLLAAELYDRGIPLAVVENAFVLGACRRLYRNPHAAPLAPVRSLRYFLPVIDEVLQMKACPASYFQYLRHKLKTVEQSKRQFLENMRSPKP
jgi:hypothetical protein